MIKDLNELKKLFRICRQHGIDTFEVGDIKFKLGEMPNKEQHNQLKDLPEDSDNPYANFPDGVLTPEQLMYYSSGGQPEDDPALKAEQ